MNSKFQTGFKILMYVLLVRRSDQMRLELSKRYVLSAACP